MEEKNKQIKSQEEELKSRHREVMSAQSNTDRQAQGIQRAYASPSPMNPFARDRSSESLPGI